MKEKKLIIMVFLQIFAISTIFLAILSSPLNYPPIINNHESSAISINGGLDVIWDANGTAICTADSNQQLPQVCSDGAGGAIITWEDFRSASNDDIYAQRINSTGSVQWTVNGTAICTADNNQQLPQICSDGAGGAIITWLDYRNGPPDVYAQKINSTGSVQWTLNGTAICTGNGDQDKPQICSDGSGGAIITWIDARDGPISQCDIYIQKINSTGSVQWTANGIAISTVIWNQELPQICSDGAGGAIITWQDFRGDGTTSDIYAQRINSTGIVQWTVNGTAICTAIRDQSYPQICSDGAGGAIITWQDFRGALSDRLTDIYAQKINSTGSIQWTADGIAVCIAIWDQMNPQICSDGTGGAIIAWKDNRNIGFDLYVQKINSMGITQWTLNGMAICTVDSIQEEPQICSDGAGGAVITWQDSDMDIYAQKINSMGSVQWAGGGIAICKEGNNQENPQICSDGAGGAFITWQDQRSAVWDIYAQKITHDYPPTSNHPNDITTTTSGSEMIFWKLFDDCGEGQYRVLVNDTDGNYYTWIDWSPWSNNTHIFTPINRTAAGVFNYTIEYIDNAGFHGISDSVIVKITSSEELPFTFLGVPSSGDVLSLLLSPLVLGIIGGFGVVILILAIVLSNNKKEIKEIKELNKKIAAKSKKAIEK